jgi:hypothetical protein
MVLKIQLSPQLNKPPRTSCFYCYMGEQFDRHQLEISIDFSKEQFADAKLSASGKFIGQGKIVLGWSKGRATEYEVFQPEIKEGRVFFLCDRALSFHVALEVSTPARAICFGRELEGDFWQLKSRRAG